MSPNVVMKNLITCQYRSLIFLESSHGFFSVSDFSVEPFHLVFVHVASEQAEMENLKATVNREDFAIVTKFVKDLNKQVDEYKKKMEENDLAD